MKPEKRDLSIYVHIPFCKSKCSYCDFLSFGGCDSLQKQYVDALCKEIDAYRQVAGDYRVQTIFFGGGTPSYLDADFIGKILSTIKDVFEVNADAEITLEGNPDSLLYEKLAVYRENSINRLSIGLQSANDDMLARMGRVHNYAQFQAAFENARKAGFQNINVDLMSGMPGESMESYRNTLEKVVKLQPEHISAYSLMVEEGTPLSENEELLSLIPREEEDRKMYAWTKQFLMKNGYTRYEISNYAKNGFECRHNKVYWTGGEYLGVGLGAASYMTVWLNDSHCEKVRFHNVENLDEYIGRFLNCDGMCEDEYTDLYHYYEDEDFMMSEAVNPSAVGWDSPYDDSNTYQECEQNVVLSFLRDYYKDLYFCKRKDEMEEFMFLGLRLMEGVSRQRFLERFHVTMDSVYGKVIQKYKEQGLLLEQGDHIFLSDQGIDVSNVVMADFML